MKNTFQLSVFYFKYLLRKRVVINCVLILLVLGFVLIPNQKANYVTLYLGNVAALANEYWIGNLAAVFSNVIISFLLFFVILNEREKEILQNTYTLEDTSPIKKMFKNGYKILGLFYISIFFLIALNLALIAANFKQINLFYFVLPVVYFSFSYLFVISVLSFFVEYFVQNKFKYIVFFASFIFALYCNEFIFDLFGIKELHSYLGANQQTSSDFAVGFMPKSALSTIIVFKQLILPKFVLYKVIWILISLLFVRLFSTIDISRKLSYVIDNPFVSKNESSIGSKINFTSKTISKDLSFKTILLKDFYLFSDSFTKSKITYLALLWLLLFVVPKGFHNILLPLLFLFCLFINGQFLCKLHFYNLGYLEKMAPFNQLSLFSSKLIVLFTFYTILLIPHLFKVDVNTIIWVLFNFFVLASVQILISNYLKNNILLDVVMICLFASYATGTPIINILKL